METYDFVFVLHLMGRILGMTYGLSQALQQRDKNIVQAMSVIVTTKK